MKKVMIAVGAVALLLTAIFVAFPHRKPSPPPEPPVETDHIDSVNDLCDYVLGFADPASESFLPMRNVTLAVAQSPENVQMPCGIQKADLLITLPSHVDVLKIREGSYAYAFTSCVFGEEIRGGADSFYFIETQENEIFGDRASLARYVSIRCRQNPFKIYPKYGEAIETYARDFKYVYQSDSEYNSFITPTLIGTVRMILNNAFFSGAILDSISHEPGTFDERVTFSDFTETDGTVNFVIRAEDTDGFVYGDPSMTVCTEVFGWLTPETGDLVFQCETKTERDGILQNEMSWVFTLLIDDTPLESVPDREYEVSIDAREG